MFEKHMACVDYAGSINRMRHPKGDDSIEELNLQRVESHKRLCKAFGMDRDLMCVITDNLPDLSVEDLTEYLKRELEQLSIKFGVKAANNQNTEA